MDKELKRIRIWIVICIVLSICCILPIFLLPEYDFSKIDLTKDENKIALVGEVKLEVYSNKHENSIDFEFAVYNLTEERLENISFYFEVRDSHNNEEYFYSEEPIGLESRKEVEKVLTGSCADSKYSTIKLMCQIGTGEAFVVSQIDELVDDNQIINVGALVFIALIIVIIVLSKKSSKIVKKKVDIEGESLANRADEIIDIEIQREKLLLEREKLTNDMLKNNNGRDMNSIQNQPTTDTAPQELQGVAPQQVEQKSIIKCRYCGHEVESSATRCSYCGALIDKDN